VTESEKSRHSAEAMYYTANAYYALEDYQKALTFFEKTAKDWPGYERRWHVLLMLAECCDILGNQDQIPISQANRKVHEAYAEILEKYPDIPAAETIKSRLEAQE